MISLRPYQEDLRAKVSAAMRSGVKRPLVVMATGGGKTAVAAYMAHTSIVRDIYPVWFLVHRRELMQQTATAFSDAGIDTGMVARGHELQPWRKAQVVLLGSLKRRMAMLPTPRVIIPDEAHHCCASTHAKVLEAYPDAWKIGLTATPERLDRRGLKDHFDAILEGPSMRWLIDNGHLADYKIFAPPSVDVSGVHTMAGDFNKAELEDVLAKSTITGDAVREYKKHADGKRAIVRSLSREDSRKVAEAFTQAGYSAVHIDGTTPDGERAAMFSAFKRGDISILCNVELFGEGVDVPGVECCIDLRPTKSLTMYLQFIGRALRSAPGKDKAIIIDHAGNVERHGLPDDPREWSLEGKIKREVRKIFTCKHCYGVFAVYFTVCPSCGALVEQTRQGRGGPVQVDGELKEIDLDAMRQRRQYDLDRKRARTLEELQAYGRQKGYKDGWAKKVYEARLCKQRAAASHA